MSNENELTAQQLKAAEALATRTPDETLDDVGERAGVTRKTLWVWWKQDAFREAVRERVQALGASEQGPILQALFKEAKGGDVPAIRLFLQWSGDLVEKQQVEQTVREVKVSERAARQKAK